VRYVDFRDSIQDELTRTPGGLTWPELKERLALPYERPCPIWLARLGEEIGLRRERRPRGPALWRLDQGATESSN
jgi:hypothetical protein